MPTVIEALQPLAPRSPEPVGRDWVPSLTRVSASFTVGWAARLAAIVVCLALLGLTLPVLAGVDRAIFEAVNGAGYGSEWVFALLDPHERLYRGILLLAIVVALATRGPWVAVGVAVAVMVAATTSYLGLEAIAVVTDRARPQSVFALVVKPPGAD